jgi:hypothetical protein
MCVHVRVRVCIIECVCKCVRTYLIYACTTCNVTNMVSNCSNGPDGKCAIYNKA